MTKGTASHGRKSGKHGQVTRCRRCGKRAYNLSKKKCSSCGYGKSRSLRSYAWQKKKGKAKQKR
ncbi:MAG TPA: 50S ribosomal protein L37e [Candidatus Nanoarchaeia archaeon]|nr:50S ribosomal protein L37e [Candidatus Nanoarchaeia archaeon]